MPINARSPFTRAYSRETEAQRENKIETNKRAALNQRMPKCVLTAYFNHSLRIVWHCKHTHITHSHRDGDGDGDDDDDGGGSPVISEQPK